MNKFWKSVMVLAVLLEILLIVSLVQLNSRLDAEIFRREHELKILRELVLERRLFANEPFYDGRM